MNDEFQDEESGGPGRERWMVSFADFMTLMFALFVVLYATSNRDMEKTKNFQESIKRFLIKAGAFGGSGDKINQGEKNTSPIEPPIQTFNQATPLSQETFDEAEKFAEEQLTETDRTKYILDMHLDELGVRITLSGAALFAADTVKFQNQAVPFLDRFGRLLKQVGRRVMVEGHYDRIDYSSALYPSSWEFAGARATTLVRFLIKRHKMAADLFMPISYGASRPLTEGKKENNRLEVVILTEELPF